MAKQYDVQGEQTVDEKRPSMKRRGLIAGAAALVAGVLAKQAAEPVAAGVDGDVVAGGTTVAAATTSLGTTALLTTSPALLVSNNFGATGDAKGDGAQGYTRGASNAGLFGRNNELNGVGTWGEAPNGTGAFGDSSSGSGVAGSSSSGAGVYGSSSSSNGVFGTSASGFGVWGEAGTGAGSGGVVGVARSAGTVGFQALAVSPAVYAGFFVGTVTISGSLGVAGSKFAVVKGADNKYRGMYAVESPECWFEDFGTGTLANGVATVKLDPLFAQHIHTDDYHVFLTGIDQHHQLIAKAKGAGSFTVEADTALATLKGQKASDLSGTFSWRVVAKRNDIKGERMPVWEMPQQANVSAKPHGATPGVSPLPKQK
jgi:hypothetical protein